MNNQELYNHFQAIKAAEDGIVQVRSICNTSINALSADSQAFEAAKLAHLADEFLRDVWEHLRNLRYQLQYMVRDAQDESEEPRDDHEDGIPA